MHGCVDSSHPLEPHLSNLTPSMIESTVRCSKLQLSVTNHATLSWRKLPNESLGLAVQT